MKHSGKRRLSLLLAVVMCITMSGFSTLAAQAADAEGYGAEQAEANEGTDNAGGADNAVMLPGPVENGAESSVDTASGENNGDTAGNTAADNDGGTAGTAAGSDGISAGDADNAASGQNGDEGGTPAVTSAPVPEGFFTKVQVGKDYDEKNGTITPFDEKDKDLKWSADCALRFDYKVPEGANMTAGTEYTFSVKASLILEGDFKIKNENGNVVANGTFTPSGDGTAAGTLVFTDQEYLQDDTEGYFYLHTKFDESKISGNGRQNITVEVTGTAVKSEISVDFEAPVSEAKVGIVKKGDSATYLKDHQVEWTVKVTPSVSNITDEHVNSLVVTDDLKANKLDYVGGSAAAVKKDGRTAEGKFEYDNGVLTFTGQGDDLKAAAWPITITFRTQYNPDYIKSLPLRNGKLVYNNKASVEITAPQYVKNPETGSVTLVESTPENVQNTAKAEDSTSVKIAYVTLDKYGALVSGNRVTWTVKIKNNLLQSDPEIVDTLPEHMDLVDGSVKLNGSELSNKDYEYIDNESGSHKLKVKLTPGTTDEQTLVYDTVFDVNEYKDISELGEIVNKADLYIGSGSNHTKVLDKEARIHIGKSLMTKSGLYDSKTHTITWTIKLKTEDMDLKGMRLEDTFGQTVNGKNINQTYVEGSLKIDGKDIDTGEVLVNVAEDGKSFTLTGLRDKHPESEEITYKTILGDTAEDREFWGNNEVKFNITNTVRLYANDGLPAKAEVTANASGDSTLLKKEFVSYDYENKTAEWKLTVNQNQMKLTNGVITDTLSRADWAFDETAGVKLMQDGKDITEKIKDVTYSKNEEGLPVMTVKLPDTEAGADSFVLTYHTKLVNKDLLLSNKKFTVKNTSVLTGNEVKNGGVSVSASQDIGQSVIYKYT